MIAAILSILCKKDLKKDKIAMKYNTSHLRRGKNMKQSFLFLFCHLLITFITLVNIGMAQVDEGEYSSNLLAKITKESENLREKLIAVRRDIHMYPELSGEEKRTSKIIAQWLSDLGLDVRTGVGGYGVVGILRGGREGPVVAYRADMDAFRSEIVGDVPYRSRVKGVKHVCGHDVHVAVGLGIASALTSIRAHVPGTVLFIFQPAEETAQGARMMLADGVLKDSAPEAIFAVHTAPLPVGTLGVGPGVGLPGFELFKITLEAEKNLDALAEQALTAIRTLSSVPSADDPKIGEILSAIAVKNGPYEEFTFILAWLEPAQENSNTRSIQGLARCSGADVFSLTRNRLRKLMEDFAQEHKVKFSIAFQEPRFPDMRSDPKLARAAVAPIEAAVGKGSAIMLYASIPYFSEDFAFFLELIPGAMFWLGAANPERGITALNHSPDYDVDEESIVIGTKAMSNVLLNYLEQHR
jgi:metal-dependent amidase/aminoacylase/carboxypeptidase family protein